MNKFLSYLAGKEKYITVFLFLLYVAVIAFLLWLMGPTLYLLAIFAVLTWVLVAGLIVIQGEQVPSWGRFGKVFSETVIIYFVQLTLGLSRGLSILWVVFSFIAFLTSTILTFTPDTKSYLFDGKLTYPIMSILSIFSLIAAALLVYWVYKYSDKYIDLLNERFSGLKGKE
ncbi:MAG: hypothetical protein WC890_03095 [Candidatus Margulisiibacteriota bacterium]